MVGLLLSMAVVAVVERRRPWITVPTEAARLLQAPLLGVGPREAKSATGAHGRDQVAPVVAMSTLRAVGNSPTGIVLLIPRGAVEVGDGSIVLARDMTPVLERAGAKVAVLGRRGLRPCLPDAARGHGGGDRRTLVGVLRS